MTKKPSSFGDSGRRSPVFGSDCASRCLAQEPGSGVAPKREVGR